MFVIYLYVFNLGSVIDCRLAGTPCSRWILFLTNCVSDEGESGTSAHEIGVQSMFFLLL